MHLRARWVVFLGCGASSDGDGNGDDCRNVWDDDSIQQSECSRSNGDQRLEQASTLQVTRPYEANTGVWWRVFVYTAITS